LPFRLKVSKVFIVVERACLPSITPNQVRRVDEPHEVDNRDDAARERDQSRQAVREDTANNVESDHAERANDEHVESLSDVNDIFSESCFGASALNVAVITSRCRTAVVMLVHA